MRPWRALAATSLLIAVASCGASKADSVASTRLTVLAASSLKNVFPEIGTEFTSSHPGVRFDFSFAGSDALAAQIEQGAPADVFAGASTKYGDQLAAENLIEAPRPFCTNRLVLVIPPSNPAGITSLEDLASKDVKLVVGSETVPVGAYTRTVLANLDSLYGRGYSESVLAHVVSNETDVESVLTKVRTGEADAGFVYVTDATASGSDVSTIHLPDQAQAVATYPAAVVKTTRSASVARQFVDYLRSPTAQAALRRAGFGPPPELVPRPDRVAAVGFGLAAFVLVGFAVLPMAAIFLRVSPGTLLSQLRSPVALDALGVSLQTSAVALALILLVGTPAAYLLGTRTFPGASTLITLLELPLVLPPAVAGIALFAAFGRFGLLGGALRAFGIEIPFTRAAVVMAVGFVAMPFYVRQAVAAFASVDRETLAASRTLGAGDGETFFRVAIPLAGQGLWAGAALAFARALGEFGATLMFAGSFQGRTQTLPLAIYGQFSSGNVDGALAMAGFLVAVSVCLLVVVKAVLRGRRAEEPGRWMVLSRSTSRTG